MKNICVIGNSHVSAIKLGWDDVRSEFPDVQLTFFAGPRETVEDTIVEGGKIVAGNDKLRDFFLKTSGGHGSIDGNYDEYLLCGLKFGVLYQRTLLAEFRADTQFVDDRIPVSSECYFESMLGRFRDGVAMQVLAKVRQISDAPISVMHQPMPSMDDTNSPAAYLRRVGDDTIVSEFFLSVSKRLSRDFNFSLYTQPEQTLRTPLHTRRRYSTGAVRLRSIGEESRRKTVRENEIFHMNAKFGARMIRPYLRSISDALA